MIRFLQKRGGAQKVMLAILVGIVSLSMVAFLGSYFTDASKNPEAVGTFATVGDLRVSTQEVMASAQREGRRMTGGKAVPEFFLPTLYQRAANNLVTQAALVEEAQRLGLFVTEEELRNELRKGFLKDQVFPNGQFIGTEQYKNFIANQFQMEVSTFEDLIKRDLLIQKLGSVITGGVTLTPKEVEDAYRRQNVKVKFDYAVLQASDLMKQVPVSQAELRAYFEQNKARYENSIPELRKARYVVVDPSKLKIEITEDDYKRAYDQRQEQFRTPEQADVRHILVKTEEQARELKKQLDAGAKFEELAKKFSDDPGSKENGGLYQGVVRNQMVPEFDQATFSLPIGKVSDPVKTSFGYHLIKVDARRDAQLRPLSDVKKELEAAIRAEKQGQQADAVSNQIQADARQEGLDKAAAKHGLTVVNTDHFPQTATLAGIGPAPQAVQQIFSINAKAPAEKIALPNGFAVVEVQDIKPAATPTFEQIRSRVESEFRTERAQQMLAQKTAELADKARSLKSLRAAAKSVGATAKSSDLVGPNAQVPDVGPMTGPASVAFDMKPGQISGPLQSGNNGLVLAITDRQEPKPEDFAKQRDQIRDQLLQAKRNEVLQVYALELRQRMLKDGKIRLNDKEQKRLLAGAQNL